MYYHGGRNRHKRRIECLPPRVVHYLQPLVELGANDGVLLSFVSGFKMRAMGAMQVLRGGVLIGNVMNEGVTGGLAQHRSILFLD